ncbi:MAG: hypothetical protein C5B55_06935 [Blastocatellia bacterium]|nr:MAG: hypothetical protein C5B55_06935 [Blastocatellia bacterium]
MGLLTSDKTTSETNPSRVKPLRLVTSVRREREPRPSSRWSIAIITMVAFVGGFGVAFLSRPAVQVAEAKIQVADFRIEIPEGQTIVTVLSRDSDAKELARLTIERRGDNIVGVPQVERRIEPRALLSADDVTYFRHEMAGVFSVADSGWVRANKIREWLAHRPFRLSMPGLSTRVPREAYEQMKAGKPVLCGNLAEIYVALLEASGLTARSVGLSVAVQNGGFGVDTHVGAEVWLPEFGGWIYEDPTFDCYWKVDGHPASALAVHDAFMDHRPIVFAPQTTETVSKLRSYYIDPRLYFRHITYEYKPGGTMLYFADKRLEPLSVTDKNWVDTGDAADIQRLDTSGHLILERRGQVAPGIFVQLLGRDLFIRDRRERSPGIRVRSTSGAVQGCAYLHDRAEDLGLFNAENLAKNPSFRFTSRDGQVADDWSVSGPVEAMTIAGGQGLAALAGGRLWQRIQVRPKGRYLMYARVTVSRGLVNWSIGDAQPGAKSMGSIEPERISEIVSDVVESESGFIDVGFDVPSGGAFRVMDVIVAEAPRFNPDTTGVAMVERHQH